MTDLGRPGDTFAVAGDRAIQFNNVLWEKCCAIKFENSSFGHCLLIQTDLWNYNLQPSYILCRSNFMFQSLKIKSYYGHFLTIIPVLTKFTGTSHPVFDHVFHQFEKIKFWLTGHYFERHVIWKVYFVPLISLSLKYYVYWYRRQNNAVTRYCSVLFAVVCVILVCF